MFYILDIITFLRHRYKAAKSIGTENVLIRVGGGRVLVKQTHSRSNESTVGCALRAARMLVRRTAHRTRQVNVPDKQKHRRNAIQHLTAFLDSVQPIT